MVYVGEEYYYILEIFRFEEDGLITPFRTLKFTEEFHFEIEIFQNFFSTFNRNLFLLYSQSEEPYAIVYNMDTQEKVSIFLDADNEKSFPFLICTPKGKFVYIYDEYLFDGKMAKDVRTLEIIPGESKAKHVSLMGMEGLDICGPINALEVHYHLFTDVKVYVSTNDKLYVVCPIKERIVKSFDLVDVSPVQSLIINWSGEEIFLVHKKEDGKQEMLVFYYCRNIHNPDSLLTLTKRYLCNDLTISQVMAMNPHPYVKKMLGLDQF